MAGIKISALPPIVTPAITDIFPVVQGGITYKETGTQFSTLFLPLSGGTLTGNLILNSDATLPLQAVTFQQLNAVVAGLTIQGACYTASTGALTAAYSNGTSGVGATLTNSGAFAVFAIDGVSPPINSRILIKNQAAPAQNGIYTLTTVGNAVSINWVLTRSLDYNQASEVNPGDFILIENGTTNAGTAWIETATVATIGTDAISFTQFTAGLSVPVAVIKGGTGLNSTTANQLLYSSAANTIAGLATAASGVLVTSAGGVPSISSILPAFTTSSITFNPATGGIVGTTTNNNATAGKIGEYLETIVLLGAAVALTASNPISIGSLALTAGDWDVFGKVGFSPAAGTTTQDVTGGISLVNNTLPSDGSTSSFIIQQLNLGAGAFSTFSLNTSRISLAAPATIYLIAQCLFSVSTMGGYGFIGARRVR